MCSKIETVICLTDFFDHRDGEIRSYSLTSDEAQDPSTYYPLLAH